MIDSVISIGGGAKNEAWLQMQADIFQARVICLKNEQGPGMGAAMIAAYGCGWFDSLQACADVFVKQSKVYTPNEENARKYKKIYSIYQTVYEQTRYINGELVDFR